MSSCPDHVIASDDLIPNLQTFGPLKHFCAVCFADTPLQRCSSCKLIFYCSTACQRSNWSEHSEICKDIGTRGNWCQAVAHAIDTFGSPHEMALSDRKTALSGLRLLENWSKSILASIGFIRVLLELIMRERYTSYNFSLVALVDLLRVKDVQSINENLCFLFVFEESGLVSVLKVLSQHAQLNFSQKLSTLRFLRLLAAHPKLQPAICDQLDTLLPLISQTAENGQSTDICSELGVFLCSVLYSATSPSQHGSIQALYASSLNLQLWMSCAFGESPWSADMEMGAVELLLALIIDVDLFPASEYDDLSRSHFVHKVLLPRPLLLKQFVFGSLDMLLVPNPVFHGAALHTLNILFSDSDVMDEVMKNLWLFSDLEDEKDAHQLGDDEGAIGNDIGRGIEGGGDDYEDGTKAESPLREVLRLFHSNPIVQLNFFQTHIHLNILHIFRYVLLSPYCNCNFVEATVGTSHLTSYLAYLEQRYLAAIGEAEKYKLTHRLSQVEKVGNEGEMEDVIKLISAVRGLLETIREDISINQCTEFMDE